MSKGAGQPYASAAFSILFDAEGRLQETGLEAAQALVLLQLHLAWNNASFEGDLKLFGLSMQFLGLSL